MVPATRNTHVRGPVAIMHSRKDPAPESASVVTGITRPPRPPKEAAPKPSALGKARCAPDGSLDGLYVCPKRSAGICVQIIAVIVTNSVNSLSARLGPRTGLDGNISGKTNVR